jgi:hypothetical protein
MFIYSVFLKTHTIKGIEMFFLYNVRAVFQLSKSVPYKIYGIRNEQYISSSISGLQTLKFSEYYSLLMIHFIFPSSPFGHVFAVQ